MVTLELPPSLEAELANEAEREQVTPSEHATLLLFLASALRENGAETPFKAAVRSFLGERSVDARLFGSALEELLETCLAHHDTGKSSQPYSSTLQSWRLPVIHRTQATELLNSPARMPRKLQAKGSCSDLGLSSEAFAKEKQEEIAREEKGWQ